MVERGRRIEGYDSEIEFIETTAESDGERVVVEISCEGSGIKPSAHIHPNPDAAALLDEFRLANPPGPLQDLLIMPLTALGKLAGMDAEYKPET